MDQVPSPLKESEGGEPLYLCMHSIPHLIPCRSLTHAFETVLFKASDAVFRYHHPPYAPPGDYALEGIFKNGISYIWKAGRLTPRSDATSAMPLFLATAACSTQRGVGMSPAVLFMCRKERPQQSVKWPETLAYYYYYCA
jgi:hypothetical protein